MRSFTYDAANRLTAVTSGTLTTTFEYDGLGNRMAQTVDGVTTEYVLDVAGGLPEVIVATTVGASTRYVQVQGQILAQHDAGAWGYVLPDALGSVRQLVGSESQVDLTQSFDPFGVLFETSGSGESDFGYTGEWWDSYMELYYLRARWYAPETGTFLSRDPMEDEPPYLYARGNPINKTDPSGMTSLPPSNGCPVNCRLLRGKQDNGYSEWVTPSTSFVYFMPRVWNGTEIVFDFATLEIAEFSVNSAIDPSMVQADLNIISWGTSYGVSYISGFEPEPDGSVVRDYGPQTVNISFGASVGLIAGVQFGVHQWLADDFSLEGQGYYYGGGLSLLAGGSPEFSYHKTFTSPRFQDDLGDVCNPEEAYRFLKVLETWPYPTINYIGLYLGRYARGGAIDKFKAYAGIE